MKKISAIIVLGAIVLSGAMSFGKAKEVRNQHAERLPGGPAICAPYGGGCW